MLVTPGWVDVHTHYDGQATWDPVLAPSSWHGVTTILFGNCGVGFAPVKKEHRGELIDLMEAVEDIPGTALHEGLDWEWESFPQFLDALERLPRTIDVAAQIPHHPLRVYVMGERGARRDPATPEDNKAMAALAGDAVRAGALGFSTSRTLNHRTSTGDYTPTLKAGEDELTAIAQAMRGAGKSVLQFVLDQASIDEDLPMMLRIADNTKCPLTLSVAQGDRQPQRWRQTMATLGQAAARGLNVTAQVAARPIGLLLGLELSRNPFQTHPSYKAIAKLPLEEKLKRLRDPSVRAAILSEAATTSDDPLFFRPNYDKMFLLGNPPDYEQPLERTLGARAKREGRKPEELAYEAMLEENGRGMLYVPFLNYSEGNLDAVHEMLREPSAVPGLSDGGAHCGIICDASFPTYPLTHWTRDRSRGEKLSIPFVVAAQSRKTALSVGLYDRGVIAPGFKADVNVIDYDRLHLHPPKVHYDLPVGGRRLMQQVDGYDATIVSGVVTQRGGKATDARPGKLVRGAQGSKPQFDAAAS
jgi:N-acyl-D-aspartate/D-glutamate deacylase